MIQRHISSLMSQVYISPVICWECVGLTVTSKYHFPKFYILPIRSLHLITHWPVNISRSFCEVTGFVLNILEEIFAWHPSLISLIYLSVLYSSSTNADTWFFHGAVLIQHVKGVLHFVTLKRCILRVRNLITFDNLFMASYLQMKKLSPFCGLMTGPQPFTAAEVCLALQWSSWASGRGWGIHSWPGAKRDTLGFARC